MTVPASGHPGCGREGGGGATAEGRRRRGDGRRGDGRRGDGRRGDGRRGDGRRGDGRRGDGGGGGGLTGAGLIVTIRTTSDAAATLALPAWLAVTAHVPAPDTVKVGDAALPLTEHGPDAVKLTCERARRGRDQGNRRVAGVTAAG